MEAANTRRNDLFDRRKLCTELWKHFSTFFGQKYFIYVILIVYIANMLAGISFAWSSPVLVRLNETMNNPLGKPITPDESDLIGSLFYLGAAVGPLLFIMCLEKLGRKPTIVIMGIPLSIAYGMLGVTRDIKVYYICRIALGLVTGGICSTIPVYASEILPARIRGSLMSLSNTFIQTGSLITYIIGPYLSIMAFNLVVAVLSLLFLLMFTLSCPESPYYVMQARGKMKSKEILENLRKTNVDDELDDIQKSLKEEIKSSYFNIFKSKRNMKALIIATMMLIIQQFTGINMVIGYSQLIFLETKIEISSANCSVIVGCLQVISSFISPLVSEKFPRKSMLYFSLFGLSVCNFLISVYFFTFKNMGRFDWLPLLTFMFFVVLDNCGNGPLPWVLLGEIYPMQVKSVGPALSTSIFYVVQFILTFSFNKIDLKYMFFGYAWCCILGIIFVRFCVPETQGRTLREIREILEQKPLKDSGLDIEFISDS